MHLFKQSQLASSVLTLILYVNVTALFLKNKQLAGGGSRTTATSKMEHVVIIVNSWKPLTITTKCSILDVAAVLDPPLGIKPP